MRPYLDKRTLCTRIFFCIPLGPQSTFHWQQLHSCYPFLCLSADVCSNHVCLISSYKLQTLIMISICLYSAALAMGAIAEWGHLGPVLYLFLSSFGPQYFMTLLLIGPGTPMDGHSNLTVLISLEEHLSILALELLPLLFPSFLANIMDMELNALLISPRTQPMSFSVIKELNVVSAWYFKEKTTIFNSYT